MELCNAVRCPRISQAIVNYQRLWQQLGPLKSSSSCLLHGALSFHICAGVCARRSLASFCRLQRFQSSVPSTSSTSVVFFFRRSLLLMISNDLPLLHSVQLLSVTSSASRAADLAVRGYFFGNFQT